MSVYGRAAVATLATLLLFAGEVVLTGVGNLLVGLWEDDAFPVIERNETISSFTHVFDTGTYS